MKSGLCFKAFFFTFYIEILLSYDLLKMTLLQNEGQCVIFDGGFIFTGEKLSI